MKKIEVDKYNQLLLFDKIFHTIQKASQRLFINFCYFTILLLTFDTYNNISASRFDIHPLTEYYIFYLSFK